MRYFCKVNSHGVAQDYVVALAAILFAAIAPTPTNARILETTSKFEERYGKPTKIEKDTLEFCSEKRTYKIRNIEIVAWFKDGVCHYMTYHRKDPYFSMGDWRTLYERVGSGWHREIKQTSTWGEQGQMLIRATKIAKEKYGKDPFDGAVLWLTKSDEGHTATHCSWGATRWSFLEFKSGKMAEYQKERRKREEISRKASREKAAAKKLRDTDLKGL